MTLRRLQGALIPFVFGALAWGQAAAGAATATKARQGPRGGQPATGAALTADARADAPASQTPRPPQAAAAPSATPLPTPLPTPPTGVQISLDQAIQLALQHSPQLAAARSQIAQSRADEITAAIRPNPTISGDVQYFPLEGSNFNRSYFNQTAEFDAGFGYTFERGHKRQARVQAAKDATRVVRSEVADAQRGVIAAVAQDFVDALLAKSSLEFARQDLASWQNTVRISQDQFAAGAVSEGDLDRIKLQTLEFQTAVSGARLGLLQSLDDLRQQVGFGALPAHFGVQGKLEFQPVAGGLDDMKAAALQHRPDLAAARRAVVAAESQHRLALADGKRDLNVTTTYSHTAATSSLGEAVSMDLPVYDRNQGEIARTAAATVQARDQARAVEQQVLTDVATAYEAVRQDAQIVGLYTSGYRNQARQVLAIRQYSFRKGASSLLTLLDAEREYRSTELGYRQALANYMLAVEELKEAVGTRTLP